MNPIARATTTSGSGGEANQPRPAAPARCHPAGSALAVASLVPAPAAQTLLGTSYL